MNAARNQQGSALIVVLVLIVVLTSMAGFLISDGFHKWRTAEDLTEKTRSLHVAEGGLDRAIAEINRDNPLVEALTDDPDDSIDFVGNIAGGSYVATVRRLSPIDSNSNGVTTDPGEDRFYNISCTGTGIATARWPVARRVEAVVNREPQAGFARAMFGDEGVTLSGAVLTDSYDSAVAPYNPAARGIKGDVASNRKVQLGGTVDVWGNATSGPGYATEQGTAFVHGSTASATEPVPLPPVVYNPPPGCLPVPGTASIAGTVSGSTVIPAGTYRCSSIDLASKKNITATGDVTLYVDGGITMTAQTSITVDDGCKLTIYHGGGDIKLSGGDQVNGKTVGVGAAAAIVMGKPEQLLLNSATTGQIDLVGNADASACVYAPKATVYLRGTAALYGSVVGKTITNVGTPDFHYDEALGRLQITALGPCTIKAWNETTE